MREAQKVDFPAPAGPVTSTASVGTVDEVFSERGGEMGRERRGISYIALLEVASESSSTPGDLLRLARECVRAS